MPNNTDVIPLVVGLSLCGASAALLYIWFQTKTSGSNTDECDNDASLSATESTANPYTELATSAVRRISRQISATAAHLAATTTEPERLLECVIPNHLVPLVEGRSGANVRAIGAQTGCKISFRPRDGSSHVCEIRGPSTAAVQLAADLVRREAQPPPIVTEQLLVPQSQCGVVVGRCGEALQEICRRSMAKVYVEAGNSGGGDHIANGGGAAPSERVRTIKIIGTQAHVQLARTLIEEKIRTEAERRCAEEATRGDAAQRSPREHRNNSRLSAQSSHSAINGNSINGERQPCEEEAAAVAAEPVIEGVLTSAQHSVSALGDGQLEVYVSAIASPSRFWLQLVGPQSLLLDAMVADMTAYYQQETNRTLHKIADPYLGQIVAALFKYDGKWYRAEIVGILPNEFNPRNVVLDLYFLDFGDSEYVAPHEVYELRTDFLTLRFQAIECYLAHVRSTNADDAEIWQPDAISRFEEITYGGCYYSHVCRSRLYIMNVFMLQLLNGAKCMLAW